MEKSHAKDVKGDKKIISMRMFSLMVKQYLSQDCPLSEKKQEILSHLNQFELSLALPDFCYEDGVSSLMLALVDLLVRSDYDGQSFLAPKAISLLHKMAKHQFLLKELINTFKIHVPICVYFNANFQKEETSVNVLILELLFAVNKIQEEPCVIKLAVINLLSCLKNDRLVKQSLACLRNYFVYSDIDSVLSVELDKEQVGYYFNRLTALCGCDDELKSIYATTIIIASITKRYSFRKLYPAGNELIHDSLMLIFKTINTEDPEIKEASFFLWRYVIENQRLGVILNHTQMDNMIKDLTKLNELDCNPISTCELLLLFLIPVNQTCLESFTKINQDKSTVKARNSNFAILRSWIERADKNLAIEGDLPLLALQLVNKIIKESDVSQEVVEILKKIKLPSIINKILLKKLNWPFNLLDSEIVIIQAECLNFVSLFLGQPQMIALVSKALNNFLINIFQNNNALALTNHKKMKLSGLNIIIQSIYIFDNAREILLPEVQSLLEKIKEEQNLETLLVSGLSSGSPILRDISSDILNTSQKSQNSIDYVSIIQKLIDQKSNYTQDVTQISILGASFSSVLDITTDKDCESSLMERKLLDKDIEIKQLKKMNSSLHIALHDQSCLIAKYSSSDDVHSEDIQHLLRERTTTMNIIKSLEARLKIEIESYKKVLNEKDEISMINSELQNELNSKELSLEEQKKRVKKQEDELVRFKHDVNKYQELLTLKEGKLKICEEKLKELELSSNNLQKILQEKETTVKSQSLKIMSLEQDVALKVEENIRLQNEASEYKQLQGQIMKLMSGQK